MSQPRLLQIDNVVRSAPYFSEWIAPWAILPKFLDVFTRAYVIQPGVLADHVRDQLAERGEPGAIHPEAEFGAGDEYDYGARVSDGLAVVQIRGPLMKHRASLCSSTSTAMLRRTIRRAAADDAVRAIMLRIESPGGTVAGTRELAQDIRAAAQRKPLHAYAEETCASAAYWLASQASHVGANATAVVGSIGTYSVLEDWSEAAENMGVRVHMIRAGEMKGAGTPGTPISAEILADHQRLIDGLNAFFLEAVEQGRGLSSAAVRRLNDGRVHLADDAKDLGLIDAVETFEEAADRLQSTIRTGSHFAMTQTPTTTNIANPTPAVDSHQPRETAREELARYMRTFGDSAGAKYFSAGLDFAEACERHLVAQAETLAQLRNDHQAKETVWNETRTELEAKVEDLESQLAEIKLGESGPIDTGSPASGSGHRFEDLFREGAAPASNN